jgi:GntR family transcriptional regulator / MocR family aminotransferase
MIREMSAMKQLTLKLDDAGEPLYMQLCQYIRREISTGRLIANEKLPSIRELSIHLGISRTPVALAYEQLIAEGYVHSRPRSGIYVAEWEPAAVLEKSKQKPETSGISQSTEAMSIPYDFAFGAVDGSHFPLAKWRRWMNRCFASGDRRLLMYGDMQGERELRVEITRYVHQFRGIRCDPGQIIVGAGTYHSLDLALQLLQDHMSCLASEESVNSGVAAMFRQFRLQVHPLKLEGDGIQPNDLEAVLAQAVYVTPAHQFPYGMTLSAAKRSRLLQWAMRNQAYIIENDFDGEFRYSGRPIPSLKSMDEADRVIYLGTFSRALLPAFRLSYLIVPEAILEKFHRRQHSYDQLASPIFQMTLQQFMSSGDLARHLKRIRSLYQKKHDCLLTSIRKHFGEMAEVIGAGSGLHVLLRMHNGMSERELVDSAWQAGVRVYPISEYAWIPKTAPESTILLGFGGLTEADIIRGLELLSAAWGGE